MKKKKSLYKIITTLTLAVPLPIYMFLSATLFNINPDVIIQNVESSEIIVEESEETTFAYTNNQNAIYNGTMLYQDDKIGFYIDETTVIQLEDGYFGFDEGILKNIKEYEIQKQTSYKLPMTFFLTAFGVGLVALIVSKKMQWHKQHPRLAVLVSLATGTLFLYLISTIVSSIFSVFLIATISWGTYYVEWLVMQGMISSEQAKKTESSLTTALKEALND